MDNRDPLDYCIGLLIEETNEAGTALGRALRFGVDTPAGADYREVKTPTGRTCIENELGDILAATMFASLHGFIDPTHVFERTRAKLAKLLDPEQRDNLGRRLAPAPPYAGAHYNNQLLREQLASTAAGLAVMEIGDAAR